MTTGREQFNILHLTDLHIRDPLNGRNELLRDGYFMEYIHSMWNAMTSAGVTRIDALIATGDFVDQAATENFSHAKLVIQQVCDYANVPLSKVVVCCGNHDIKRDEDKQLRHDSARYAYNVFSKTYANGASIGSTPHSLVVQLGDNAHALMLDATLDLDAGCCPGSLSDVEIDEIMRCVRELPREGLLIVASHFPMKQFDSDMSLQSDPDYYREHFWPKALGLRKRLEDYRTTGLTVWLYGDIHKPQSYAQRKHIHVCTDRFGCPVDSKDPPRPRQARVIKVDYNTIEQCSIITANYQLQGNRADPLMGDWHTEVSPPRQIFASNDPGTATKSDTLGDAVARASGIIVINETLQAGIYKHVRDEELFTLGRFSTSRDHISLGWITIGPLLNTSNCLTRFCTDCREWLQKHYDLVPYVTAPNFVFLGLDCWGGVLGALLSASTGASNYCLGRRGDGRYHTGGEKLDDEVVEVVNRAKTVVVVTDVIASGHSVADLRAAIAKKLPSGVKTDQIWLALAVIVDANLSNLDACHFLSAIGAGCHSIHLPTLPSSALPGEDIAPTQISLA